MVSSSSLRPNSTADSVNKNVTISNQYLSGFVPTTAATSVVPVALDTMTALSAFSVASDTVVALMYPTVAGCDGIPSSSKRLDSCGVCGGNGGNDNTNNNTTKS